MKNFERPIAELIALTVADIITTSEEDPEWSEDREDEEEWED